LQAERKSVVHVDGDEVEPPEFQAVTVENIEAIESRAPEMNLADLDLPDVLLDQVPETVATEDEVDALVKLFLETAEA
jgi:type IV secretion system protein VirD4